MQNYKTKKKQKKMKTILTSLNVNHRVFDFSFLNHLLHQRESMTLEKFIETIAVHGIDNKKQVHQLSLFVFLECISTANGQE